MQYEVMPAFVQSLNLLSSLAGVNSVSYATQRNFHAFLSKFGSLNSLYQMFKGTAVHLVNLSRYFFRRDLSPSIDWRGIFV